MVNFDNIADTACSALDQDLIFEFDECPARSPGPSEVIHAFVGRVAVLQRFWRAVRWAHRLRSCVVHARLLACAADARTTPEVDTSDGKNFSFGTQHFRKMFENSSNDSELLQQGLKGGNVPN